MDTKEEEISNLVETNSFRDRVNETKLTRFLKYCGSFIFATIQVILNVYLLAIGVVTAFISGLSSLFDWERLPGFMFFLENVAWILLASFILMNITNLTTKNIRSKEVNILWAVNFLGKIKNSFYSKEIAKNHIKTTNAYIDEVAKELVEDAVKDYEMVNQELQDVLKRLQEKTANFPVEFFDSLIRMTELLTYSILNKEDKRFYFDTVLDKFLGELCTYIPGAHQGSIFLYNGQGYKAFGNFNIKESSLRNKIFNFSEGFSGAVATERNAIWVDNVDTKEAEKEFGFSPNSNRTYSAIFGFPILSPKKQVVGIINIHFLKPIYFTELETINIEKLTQIVSHYILSLIQLNKYPIDVEDDIIIKMRKDGDKNVGENKGNWKHYPWEYHSS
ncbi:GAF domain-containing protein [Peribacillus simplex]|uniref:GAF domain-containing protein n=1 Tax=Peribacillus simplex TaxID=1478 RepID=UPI002989B85E|nr:GAF domain-containing protein [Peribacillus simplex]MBX9955076.1 GAF domain-containing protein [Peribacillus simplex]